MCLSRNRDVAVLGIWWLPVVTWNDMLGEGHALGTEHILATGHATCRAGGIRESCNGRHFRSSRTT